MEGRKFSTSRDVVIYVGDFLERYDAGRPPLLPHGGGARDPGHRLHVGGVRSPQQRRARRELGQPRQPHARRTRTATSARCPRRATLTDGDRAVLADVEAGFDSIGELIEQARFRAALAEAMRLATRVNQYVSEQAPWAALESDRDRAGTVLYVALRCIDSLKMLFTPFLPFSSQTAPRAARLRRLARRPARDSATSRRPDGASHAVLTGDYAPGSGAGSRARLPAGQKLGEPRPLFRKLDPRPSSPRSWRGWKREPPRRDRHPRAPRLRATASSRDVLARAREAGVDASRHDRHRDRRPVARALAIAEAAPTASSAALGIHPHQAAAPDAGRLDELRELLAAPARGRGRRDGPRLLPRLRADDARAARALRRAARSRRRARQAGRDPHPRRERRHAGDARSRSGARSSCTASPRRSSCEPRSSAATTSRSPATSRTRRPTSFARAARQVPQSACSPRPTARTSPRSPCAGRTSRPTSSTRSRRSPRRAARSAARARAPDRGERDRCLRPGRCMTPGHAEEVRSGSTSSSTRTSSA